MVAATCITVQYTLQVGGIGKKKMGGIQMFYHTGLFRVKTKQYAQTKTL